MNKINNYPKILTIGHSKNHAIFSGPVVIEEKVDGSQFSFGISDGEYFCKSKNRVIDMDNPDKMFASAVDTVRTLDLWPGWTYRGEVLCKPKHNTLAYDRVPVGNIIVFDIMMLDDENYLSRHAKEIECRDLGLEVVPLLFEGELEDKDGLEECLKLDSILGKQKIEGIVIKNYNEFNRDNKPMFCKLVRDDFKEQNGANHSKPKSKDVVKEIGMTYNNVNLWNKAVQRLRESGRLNNESRDIGNIIKEVFKDMEIEAREEIEYRLYTHFKKTIMGYAVRGLPEWYNGRL